VVITPYVPQGLTLNSACCE